MKIKLLAIALCIVIPAMLSATDWAALGVTESGNDYVDENGYRFEILDDSGMNDAIAAQILRYIADFYEWDSLEIDMLTVTVDEEGVIDLALIPEAFVVDGEDITASVPAGLAFYYEDELRYDFRMKIGEAFLKIEGLYINEHELLEKVREAIEDPDAYIQRDDADYFLAKIDELEDERDRLALRILELETDVSDMKQAMVSLVNHGLFGGPNEVTDELVEAVTAIKEEHPAYGMDEIREALDAKDIDHSKREVSLILIVYYGEYE